MKFLHVMQNEKFTAEISEFYNYYFCNGDHEICYFLLKDESINLDNRIKSFEFIYDKSLKSRMQFLKILKNYDYIVLHSLFLDNGLKMLIKLKKLYRKIVWIEWGYDLYNWIPKGKFKFLTKPLNFFLRNNFNSVVCIFEPDVIYYKNNFPKSMSKVFYAPYCGPFIIDEYKHYSNYSRLNDTNLQNDEVYVQIGHSANTQINHINILHMLSKFKNEKIKLFIPLSYGDKNYAKKVKDVARSLFDEDKLIFLDEFVPIEKYYEITKRIDIAIFDTDRQIALANIQRLIFRNVKIFLTDNSVMYDYFISKGVPIQGISLIDKLTFSEFKKCVKTDNVELFKEFIDSYSNINKRIEPWKNVYNSVIGK